MMSSMNYNNQSIHNRGPSVNSFSSGVGNGNLHGNFHGNNIGIGIGTGVDTGIGNPNTNTSALSDNFSVDETISSYHHTFCQFTGNYNGIWDSVNRDNDPQFPGSKARQKLKNLSKIHFSELSTDVYDELVRRVDPLPHETQFLSPRENIHRKRNQARQKLAMLSPSRFNDLATDILYEIERRYPNLRADPPTPSDNQNGISFNNDNIPTKKSSPDGSSSSPSPYLNARPLSSASAVSNATSRYTNDENYHLRDSVMPPRRSSLINQKPNDGETTPPLPSISGFGHAHNTSLVPPLQEEVSIPPSNRYTPLAQPIKTTTIVPTKSVLVEEGDDDEEDEFDNSSNGDDEESFDISNRDISTLSSNGSVRNSRRISMQSPLSDIEEEGEAARLAAAANSTLSNQASQPSGEDAIDDESIAAELKDKDEQIQMLVEEGSRMDETINKLETQLTESETLKSTLEEENNRLHDMLNDLEEQRQKAVDEKDTVQEQLEEAKKELDSSVNMISNHQTTIETLQGENTRAASETSRIQALLDQLREEHSTGSSDLQSTVEDLKEQNIRHAETITNHELTIDEMKTKLQDINDSHSNAIDELKNQHSKEIEELTTNHSKALQEQIDLHSNELESVKSNHQRELEEVVATHSATIEELNSNHQRELDDHIANLANLKESHNTLEQEYGSLKDRHNDALSKQNEFAESSATLSNDFILLQSKISDHENTIASLKQEAEGKSLSQTYDDDLQTKYNELYKDHSKLQDELVEQHKITEQVRQEAKEFLMEMRTLAENQRNLESAEELASQVHSLKMEVQEWKSRYSRAKGQVRNLRNSTYGGASVFSTHDFSFNIENPFVSDEGRVRDVSVTKFQIAVDEFLTKSRLGTSDLLDNLHNVVIATRHITQDLNGPDDTFAPVSEKMESDLAQCATLVSKTANQLISTTRNHRISGGLAPISILDAVTSDLSFAVVELIKVAKIRRSVNRESFSTTNGLTKEIDVNAASRVRGNSLVVSPTELHRVVTPTEDIHMERTYDSKRYASLRNGSEYTMNFNIEDPDNTIAELQGYLEEQTASAIDSIQALLTGIKDGSNLYVLRHYMLDIIKLVDVTVVATSTSMKQTKNWLLKDKGSYILENLRDCSQRMAQLDEETKNIDGDSGPDRQLKQRLAGIAFDMAKFTKELVKTVEEVGLTSEINHIDEQLR